MKPKLAGEDGVGRGKRPSPITFLNNKSSITFEDFSFRNLILYLIDTHSSKNFRISYLGAVSHPLFQQTSSVFAKIGFSKSFFFVNINSWNQYNYFLKPE